MKRAVLFRCRDDMAFFNYERKECHIWLWQTFNKCRNRVQDRGGVMC